MAIYIHIQPLSRFLNNSISNIKNCLKIMVGLIIKLPMKWKVFWCYSIACYVYFSKLPKANNFKERKIWLFAAQSSNLTTKSESIVRAAKMNVLQGRDVGNCSDDFIATFQLLYVGTFTRGQISIKIWHFTCKKNGELWRNLLWQFT